MNRIDMYGQGKAWFEDVIQPYIAKGWRVHFFDNNIVEIKNVGQYKTFTRGVDHASN